MICKHHRWHFIKEIYNDNPNDEKGFYYEYKFICLECGKVKLTNEN